MIMQRLTPPLSPLPHWLNYIANCCLIYYILQIVPRGTFVGKPEKVTSRGEILVE